MSLISSDGYAIDEGDVVVYFGDTATVTEVHPDEGVVLVDWGEGRDFAEPSEITYDYDEVEEDEL